ncbi:hypothetical protein HK101_005818 [Irineochytrium annulatum]|nr:hypothetical protein HK101_005818 [Irineochytrium annulatum]
MARALNRSRSPASSVDSDKPAVRAPGASRVGGTGSKTPKAQAPAPGLATPGASSSTGPLGGGIHLTEDDDPDAFPLPNANDVEPFPTHLIPWYQKQAVAGPTECSPSSAPPALLAGPAGNAPPPIDAMLAEITSTLASVAQSPVVAMSVISAFAERERRLQRAGLRPDRKLGKGVDVKSLSEQEKRDRMERVVSQHGRALTFVEEKADAGERLSVALIKECHGILCEGLMAEGQVAGEFRKSGARAGATGFPAHTRVDKLMDVTISIYNRMEESEIYSPFARASWLVCQFITIHPFSDGNGRASRLLLIYALRRSIPWSFTGSPVWNALMGLSGKVLPGGIPDDFESYITGVPFAISITNSEAHRDHYVAAIKASRPWADSAPRGEAVLVRRTGFLAHIVLHQTWIRCRVVAGMMAERHLEEALGVVPPTVNAHVGEGLGRERSPARSSGSGKGKNKRDHLDMADGDEDADEGSATRRRLSPGLGPPKAKKKGNLGHDSDDDDGDEPGGRKRWKGKERVTEAAAAKVAAPAPAPVKEPEVPKQMTAEEERAQTCVVCMDGEVQVRTTCCRQFYHLQCLFKWSVSNPTCPSCRHSLTMERQGMTRDELVRDAAAALQVLFDAAGAMRAVGDALPVDDTSLSTTESEDDDGDNTSTTDVIEDPLAIEDESTLVDNVIVVDDTETSEVVFDEDDTTETVDAADESTSTTSEAVDDTTESITAAIPVPEPQDTVNLSAYRGRNVPSWIPEKRCPYCNRRFHSADDLQDHLRHTTTHDIWTCCGKIFLSGSAFSNHHRAVHE